MKILFCAGFGPIVKDGKESRKLYIDTLGIPLKPNEMDSEYYHTGDVEGVKAFALWPLSSAAKSCFGKKEWPKNIPTPTSWLEFDVENLTSATEELKAKGYRLLVEDREEPWKQRVTRFLSPEGILVAITYTPWLREKK